MLWDRRPFIRNWSILIDLDWIWAMVYWSVFDTMLMKKARLSDLSIVKHLTHVQCNITNILPLMFKTRNHRYRSGHFLKKWEQRHGKLHGKKYKYSSLTNNIFSLLKHPKGILLLIIINIIILLSKIKFKYSK